MLRTLTLAFAGFGVAVSVGCSAGNSGASNANGGRTSGAGSSSGGTTSSAGSAGAPGGSANVGGNTIGGSGASTAGVSGSGGSAAGSAGSSAGTGGTAVSGGAGGTSSTPPLFSDDFEAPTIDMTKWTPRIIGSNGVFSIDTSQKHSGKQSLHVVQSGFSTMLAKEGAPVFPAPSNSYYARLWIRVGSGGTGMLPTGHVVWIEAGEVTNDTHEVRVGANLGYFQSNLFESGTNSTDTDIRDPMAAMTTDAWHCIQIHYGNDLFDVTLDGVHSSISTTDWVAAISANGSNMTPKAGWSPTYAAFRIGWELGGPADAWYDDVALDYAPIACN
ncbi:MAG TPA: hypothetical protein VGM44_14815 [Polyangiaceae bacterium]|jgi:hypothetical protein